MTAKTPNTPHAPEKRLADALRVADWRRDRVRRRRHLRVAVPTGHHEAELRPQRVTLG